MKRIIPILLLALSMVACSTFQKNEPLPASGRVDLDRFLGRWYVVASIPSRMDSQAHNAVHVIQRQERGFQITYQFNDAAPDGELKAYATQANITNPGLNTEWKVRLTWPFSSTYRVIHIADDHQFALVGHPDRSNAWILSRTPVMDPADYSDLIFKLQGLQYNVGRIRKIPHG